MTQKDSWTATDTNLPTTIAALQPQIVQAARYDGLPMVDIQVSGGFSHRGLMVILTNTPGDFMPHKSSWRVIKIAEGIFEYVNEAANGTCTGVAAMSSSLHIGVHWRGAGDVHLGRLHSCGFGVIHTLRPSRMSPLRRAHQPENVGQTMRLTARSTSAGCVFNRAEEAD